MKINMQKSENEGILSFVGCEISLVGKPVDDRGNAAVNYLIRKSAEVCSIEYDADTFVFNIKDKKINAEDVTDYLSTFRDKSITLEATTLGFVEILLCCRALKELGIQKLQLLYVEPSKYKKPRRSQLLHKRDFELSDEFPGYIGIPGATMYLSDRYMQRGVFFLGYEERRLDRALEDYSMIKSDNCSVVFGVPAYKPGWEMDAFANNIRVIKDKNIRGGIYYCGAENPAATVILLNEIYSGLRAKERMFIAPIGTKPNGIGVALFVADHPDVGILYDHPKKREKRSIKVSNWHLYDVEF